VLVLHGGVDDDLTLDKLRQAPRGEYRVVSEMMSLLAGKDSPQKSKGFVRPDRQGVAQSNSALAQRLKPIVSALWNDPGPRVDGVVPNGERQLGWLFGADAAGRFLEREGLSLLVRSHQMVQQGFDWPFHGKRTVLTVFSASNYSGKANNKGAIALLGAPSASGAISTARLVEDGKGAFRSPFGTLRFVQHEAVPLSALVLEQRVLKRLQQLVIIRREPLRQAYKQGDAAHTGRLPAVVWARETARVLGIDFPFLSQREVLLGATTPDASSDIDYEQFLNRFHVAELELEPLYPHHEVLLALLHRADSSGQGSVTFGEIETVCSLMRSQFGEEAELCKDGATLLAAIGPLGDTATEGTDTVAIAAISERFELVPTDMGRVTPPSVFGMLRMTRNYRRSVKSLNASPD